MIRRQDLPAAVDLHVSNGYKREQNQTLAAMFKAPKEEDLERWQLQRLAVKYARRIESSHRPK